MNRRSFLKSVGKIVGGVLGIGAVGLPKAKTRNKEPLDRIGYWEHLPTPRQDEGHWFIIKDKAEGYQKPNEYESELSCMLEGRKFLFAGRRIRWSEVGEHNNFAEHSYMDLPAIGSIWKVVPFYSQFIAIFVGNEKWVLEPTYDDLVVMAICISKDYREGIEIWGKTFDASCLPHPKK